MSNDVLNTIILTVVMAFALGIGYYVTQQKQPERLEALIEEEEAIRLRQAELQDLLGQEAIASEQAAEAYRRWNARYKILPEDLSSPDVVDYLNALSRSGFRSFDLTLAGVDRQPNFSVHSYNITGLAYFESLYAFIWNVENGRGMYRVRDLSITKSVTEIPNPETGVGRQLVLARFSMAIDGYFAGGQGMSAPDSIIAIPTEVLPPRTASMNPFFPIIMDDLPPNTDNLVDLEFDELVSVVGQQAIFDREGSLRSLGVGDRVYLGRVALVDPTQGRVVIDMNKGGILERVELNLQTGERYRQALGSVELAGMGAPDAGEAPPAPGTPEARREGTYNNVPTP